MPGQGGTGGLEQLAGEQGGFVARSNVNGQGPLPDSLSKAMNSKVIYRPGVRRPPWEWYYRAPVSLVELHSDALERDCPTERLDDSCHDYNGFWVLLYCGDHPRWNQEV